MGSYVGNSLEGGLYDCISPRLHPEKYKFPCLEQAKLTPFPQFPTSCQEWPYKYIEPCFNIFPDFSNQLKNSAPINFSLQVNKNKNQDSREEIISKTLTEDFTQCCYTLKRTLTVRSLVNCLWAEGVPCTQQAFIYKVFQKSTCSQMSTERFKQDFLSGMIHTESIQRMKVKQPKLQGSNAISQVNKQRQCRRMEVFA